MPFFHVLNVMESEERKRRYEKGLYEAGYYAVGTG